EEARPALCVDAGVQRCARRVFAAHGCAENPAQRHPPDRDTREPDPDRAAAPLGLRQAAEHSRTGAGTACRGLWRRRGRRGGVRRHRRPVLFSFVAATGLDRAKSARGDADVFSAAGRQSANNESSARAGSEPGRSGRAGRPACRHHRRGQSRRPDRAEPARRQICARRERAAARRRQSYLDAQSWYLKAAQQDWPDAQYRLGVMYEKGIGTGKDVAKAVQLYRSAAEHGYAEAQNLMGILYSTGSNGVTEDDKQALDWFQKAADQGLAKAQKNLG